MARCVLAYCTWRSLIGRPIRASFIIFNPSSFYASTQLTLLFLYIFQLFRFPLLSACFRRAMRARSTDNNPAVINRTMLRFRPIAPKPVGDDTLSAAPDLNKTDLAGRRVKRKYVRSRGRQSKRRPPPEKGALTLPLLRDRSEGERKICADKSEEKADRCVVDDDGRAAESNGGGSVIETWIIMESVTEKFVGVGLGFSDRERMCNLERDACPGFVSDGGNNVVWVNPAYRRMVAEEELAAAEKGFLVWLVVREEIPHICPSFACRVRVTQQRGQGQKWNKIVPCDVWRMEFGGFAWKLDVNTALTLGY